MKTTIYHRNGLDFIVEECTRKEIIEIIGEAFWSIRYADDIDTSVSVLYRDGHWYTEDIYCGRDETYKKTNIVFACVSNSATQQVFGKYVVDDNGIVEAA